MMNNFQVGDAVTLLSARSNGTCEIGTVRSVGARSVKVFGRTFTLRGVEYGASQCYIEKTTPEHVERVRVEKLRRRAVNRLRDLTNNAETMSTPDLEALVALLGLT